MENKEKILLASTCGLGAVSIVFISLFAWKATTGGTTPEPEPVDHVKINFTTEGCKVYKDDKTITTDEAIKDTYQTYTIKLDDEYKQDYDLSEYSLKVYTLDGEEYDPTRYAFNYNSGTLSINPGEEINVKCRATLAVTKFTYVYSVGDSEVTLNIQGLFDYVDWGDGNRLEFSQSAAGSYIHEYENVTEGTEYTIRIVGNVSNILSINPSSPNGPSWLKEAYFSHYTTNISTSLMSQRDTLCPVENVYIEDGIEIVPALSTKLMSIFNIIKSVRLPETAKHLSGTFRETQFIEEITIPDSVTAIGNGLVSYSQIKKVNFTTKSKLTHICDGAFTSSIIESLTLPKYVSHINVQAFNKCTSLETLDLSLLNSVPYLGDIDGTEQTEMATNVFNNCNALKKIIVPKGMRQAYLADESWKAQEITSGGAKVLETVEIVEAE